jgi:predicted N-acetyltransferase YhbS
MSPEPRALRESEYEECLDLWQTVWPGDNRRYFARYFYGDHDFQPEYTRVIEQDGRLVSAVHIVKRTVSCGDLILTMGGIANVATLPEYRGHGYNTACLQQAVAVMEADAMDLSLLFTGIHSHYERVGWERVPGESLTGTLRPRPEKPFDYYTIRPYEERDDVAIHLVHVAFNRRRPLTVRRSAAYWRDWLGWWKQSVQDMVFVAEEEGIVVGYLFYTRRGGEDAQGAFAGVREFGVRDGAEAAIEPLLDRAAQDALEHGIPRLRVPLFDSDPLREARKHLFSSEERTPSNGLMVRFLHRDNLLHGLAPELTDHWHQSGAPSGSLIFDTPYGATRLEAASSFLRITPCEDTKNEGALPLSQADLFHLLVGRGLPADRLSPADTVFADALFPRFDAWFWSMDGF